MYPYNIRIRHNERPNACVDLVGLSTTLSVKGQRNNGGKRQVCRDKKYSRFARLPKERAESLLSTFPQRAILLEIKCVIVRAQLAT